MSHNVLLASSVRTAVGKSPRGALRTTRPDDLAAAAITGALARIPQLAPAEIEDVILGCAMPEAEQGMNVAKIAAFRAGLPVTTSAMTVNRYCASGLQSIALAADRIASGAAECLLAGGTESMSMVPFGGNKISVNPWLVENYPGSYMSMGLTAERVAKHYGITREQQDQFAFDSHRKALRAQSEGHFADEIVPVDVVSTNPNPDARSRQRTLTTTTAFEHDEGPRADTSLEALARLKPVFHAAGTVTAGNSSQTSDGAAATILLSRARAEALGITPLARFIAFATAGCDPEQMGIGPIHAIPKLLRMTGLALDDIGVFELNEAFAAQSLAVLKVLGIDPARVNLSGGAIALGHPLGCTGAKLTATLVRQLQRTGSRYGIVTMCVGGGMGAAGMFERID